MEIQTISTKGLTFGSLFKLNTTCFAPILAVIFILVGVVNIFIPSSITPTTDGMEMTGLPAIGMLVVFYPIFVLGFSLNSTIFMKIGLAIYTKFKPIKLSFISLY